MKKILLPIDFSECSLRTAKYTLRMFAGNSDARIILYYLFHKPENEASAQQAFGSVRYGLPAEFQERIDTFAEEGTDFPGSLSFYAKSIGADLIVACLSHKTLKLVQEHPCPVMIVPSEIEFHEIRTVAIASDFHHVSEHTPIDAIRPLLEMFHPELHIVNVDSDFYITPDEQHEQERRKLADLFEEFDPKFDFLDTYNYEESMRLFVEAKGIDLLITIPHRHNKVTDLFRKHHTEKLVSHSSIPVVAAHE